MFKCSHYLFKTRIKATEAAFDNPLSINIKLFALINPRTSAGEVMLRGPDYLIIGVGDQQLAAVVWRMQLKF